MDRPIAAVRDDVLECDSQFATNLSCSRQRDSVQKPSVIFGSRFVPDWFSNEFERPVGFHKRAPAGRNLRIAE